MMKRMISGTVIAAALLSSFAMADVLPVCGSSDDAMLGACQLTQEANQAPHLVSAKNLTSYVPEHSLPIIKYIGQDPIFPTPTPDLPILKTIPVDFPASKSTETTSTMTNSTSSEGSSLSSASFPFPYTSIEEAKHEKKPQGIIMKTLPVGTSSQNVIDTLDEKNTLGFSRGEACELIAKAVDLPLFSSHSEINIFSDVNNQTPFFSSINALKNITAIDGYDDGSFKPLQQINQAEGYKMLAITFHLSKASDETKGNNWYASFKTSLAKANIIPDNFSTDDGIGILKEDFMTMIQALKSLAK